MALFLAFDILVSGVLAAAPVCAAAAPDDGVSAGCEASASPQPGPGEDGYVFYSSMIKVGNYTETCRFKVTSEAKREVQIDAERTGYDSVPAIPSTVQGAITLPEKVSISISGKEFKYTVTGIGDFAFAHCAGVTSTGLESNSTVTSLGAYAFYGCSSLNTTGLNANSTISSLGDGAFSSCTSLLATGLESNSSIGKLGDHAFSDCSHLTSTGLARNKTTLREIGRFAFQNCRSLGTVLDGPGQSNAGDLVLNAPVSGGQLKVELGAFAATGYKSIYLRGKKEDFIFASSALFDCKIAVVYVPISWAGTSSWSAGGASFSVSTGSLVIMIGAEFSDMSAERLSGARGDATVSLTTNLTSLVHLSSSDGTDLGAYPISPDSQGRVAFSVPASRGLTLKACRLTASGKLDNPIVYPTGAVPRSYNTEGAGATESCDLAAVAYQVAFVANGATGGSTAAMKLVWGLRAPLSTCGFTWPEHDFIGWSTTADGAGARYADREVVGDLTDVQNSTVKLYAQWRDRICLSLSLTARGSSRAGGPPTPLAGCGVTLTSDPAGTNPVTGIYTDPEKKHPVTKWPQLTASDGNLSLYGLVPGTYYIANTRAPAGFGLLTRSPQLVVADNGAVTLDGRSVDLHGGKAIPITFDLLANAALPSAGAGSSGLPAVAAGTAAFTLALTYLVARRAACG